MSQEKNEGKFHCSSRRPPTQYKKSYARLSAARDREGVGKRMFGPRTWKPRDGGKVGVLGQMASGPSVVRCPQ